MRRYVLFKKQVFCLILAVINTFAVSQTYNIAHDHQSVITTCSGTVYDSGGPTGNYGNNENYYITFCSANQGEEIFIALQIDTESNYDYVYVYDGPTITSPSLGSWSGVSYVNVNSTNGCLTIRFTSDGSIIRPGFEGVISCEGPPPPPPLVSSADCFGAIPVCKNIYTEDDIITGTGNISELNSSNNGCLSGNEHNSRWYTFTMATSGTLTFTIHSTHDYDWALWNITGRTCWDIMSGTLPMLRCNYSATTGATGLSLTATGTSVGASGSPWCKYVDALAGETYVLLVDKFTASSAEYSLAFNTGGGNAQIVLAHGLPVVTDAQLLGYTASDIQIRIDFSNDMDCLDITPDKWLLTGPNGDCPIMEVECLYGNYSNAIVLHATTQDTIVAGDYVLDLAACIRDLCWGQICKYSKTFTKTDIVTQVSEITNTPIQVFMPNAFTPNADGKNDFFGPAGLYLARVIEFSMQIFDKNGSLVYHTKDKDKPWDGRNHKTLIEASQDIYTWMLILKDDKEITNKLSGTVLLLR